MLVVSLVTLGSPEQLTGGYLYHRRMAEMAADHDARIGFVAAGWARNPLVAEPADIVLVDSIAAAIAAPWAWRYGSPSRASRDRPPLVAILHQPPGGIDHRPIHRTAQAALDRFFYRRCRLLLAASDALADELVAEHGLPAERIEVVPPGADVAPVPAALPDLRQGRSMAFLSVGNWVARKGTLDLLEAFAGIDPELAILHLVGRDDVEPRYATRVGDRLQAPDLAGRVIYHGAISRGEVAAMYRAADVFVLPSLREPYGTVYGEALAAGLPVVGWRAGNLPYLAEDGREGVIVEPGDIAALSAALRRLAGDHEWRAQLSAAALERGRRLPTWDDTAAALFGALSGLAQSG